MKTFIEFSRYYIVFLFGMAVAVGFAGMARTRRNRLVLVGFSIICFALQFASLRIWGMEMTEKLYPLLAHLPVILFITFYLKRSLLIALNSMLVSFLCCQLPRWIGTVLGQIFGNVSVNHVGYMVSAFLMYYFLQKYVVESVRHLLERSVKSSLLFGAMPALYYLFEHAATVYTDSMYSGVLRL